MDNSTEDQKNENFTMRYCELIDEEISADSEYFKFESHVRMAFASIGLAASTGVRITPIREILDMVDKLYTNVNDSDIVLSDEHRKKLNHADDVWLDLKEKMSAGDIRSSHLLAASTQLFLAHSSLVAMSKDEVFGMHITAYSLKYFQKLAVFIYREAIGHLML